MPCVLILLSERRREKQETPDAASLAAGLAAQAATTREGRPTRPGAPCGAGRYWLLAYPLKLLLGEGGRTEHGQLLELPSHVGVLEGLPRVLDRLRPGLLHEARRVRGHLQLQAGNAE